jgi:hypothetical protein
MSNQKSLAIVFIVVLTFLVVMGIMGAAQEQNAAPFPTIAPPPVNSK